VWDGASAVSLVRTRPPLSGRRSGRTYARSPLPALAQHECDNRVVPERLDNPHVALIMAVGVLRVALRQPISVGAAAARHYSGA
jgi:hypothetical protein